jgi:hypothetical protein
MSKDEANAMSDKPAAVEHGGEGDEWREMWTQPYDDAVESTLIQVDQFTRALAEAISPPQVIEIEAKIAANENCGTPGSQGCGAFAGQRISRRRLKRCFTRSTFGTAVAADGLLSSYRE